MTSREGLSDKEKLELQKQTERLGFELILLQRSTSVSSLVKKYQPNLLS
jgi:hypothetical protein